MQREIVPLAENVVEDVAQRAAKIVERAMDAFAPDGRPFGMEERTDDERLDNYLQQGLHDNPDAALNWIRTHVAEVQQRLQGMPEDVIASIHPFDLVQRAAIVYSANMEELLRKRQDKELMDRVALAMAPTTPSDEGEESWDKSALMTTLP